MKKRMTDEELKATIEKLLKDEGKEPTTITELGKKMGYNKISGDLCVRIRKLLPRIDKILRGYKVIQELSTPKNKPVKKSATTPANKNKPAKKNANDKPVKKSKYPVHPKNPFRVSSSYFSCFNILAHFKDGTSREELVKLLAKETGKAEKNSYYDAQVILSAKESNTGSRHKSCKEGFWVKKENSHVTLMID